MQRFGIQCSLRSATALLGLCAASVTLSAAARADEYITVPASRSHLVRLASPMYEVLVADPEIADVHAHGNAALSINGKKPGVTTVRVLDKNAKVLGTYTVAVSYDLPSIRKALKNFLPDEVIGVEMVNANVALTGQVSNAGVVDKAVRIVDQYVKPGNASSGSSGGSAAAAVTPTSATPALLNLLQVTSGQQVMLRVRVGEIQRDALKQFGIDWSNFGSPGSFFYQLSTGSGVQRFISGSTTAFSVNTADSTRGYARVGWASGGTQVDTLIRALERDGLFKLLAEPNLVAVSGEEADFLAGGEIPVPVPQGGTNSNSSNVTIEYKPFGVAVKFKPLVLSENRIRMEVQPEVSELDDATAVTLNNFRIPGINTRRARTTVELAPGESFMIAGLIKDQTRSNIDQLPGVKELPVLGALFRSTSFRRNETDLVISVTPYVVDPGKGGDVQLPTATFTPASQMDRIFYGALSTLRGDAGRISQTPSVEGPIGFMVD